MQERTEMAIYVQLYHGREDPDDILEDWGTQGPLLGPLEQVQWTYQAVKLHLPNYSEMIFLTVVNDLIYYDGVYYGDASIINLDPTSPVATTDAKQVEREKCRP